MRIYILRHGIAEDGHTGGSDADRELTSEGKSKLRDILKAVKDVNVAPDLIISSPYKRALQTAEIAADVLNYKSEILRSKALVPSADTAPVWDEIREHRDAGELMLVGHEPLLSQVVGMLLATPSLQVDMKKGALVRIDVSAFGPQPRGVLKWMMVPKLA